MVNWNTIVSSFNAKGTLLKWLKQVDEQLEQGQLESVTVADETTTSFCLLFTFADGTTIKTDAITKLAGADGKDGKDGQDGANIYWHFATITGIKGFTYGAVDDSLSFELTYIFPSLSNEVAEDLADLVSKSEWERYFYGTVVAIKTGSNAGNYIGSAIVSLDDYAELRVLLYKMGVIYMGFDDDPTIAAFDGRLDFQNCSVVDFVAGVE